MKNERTLPLPHSPKIFLHSHPHSSPHTPRKEQKRRPHNESKKQKQRKLWNYTITTLASTNSIYKIHLVSRRHESKKQKQLWKYTITTPAYIQTAHKMWPYLPEWVTRILCAILKFLQQSKLHWILIKMMQKVWISFHRFGNYDNVKSLTPKKCHFEKSANKVFIILKGCLL